MAVEAPVHHRLHAPPGRLEDGGDGQGGPGHGQAGAVRQQPAQQHHDRAVAEAEQHRQQRPGQGAAEDPVQVVQPVAQDRGADGQRQDHDVGVGGPQPHGLDAGHGAGRHPDGGHPGQDGGQGDPAQLQALDPTGAAEPDDQRPGRDQDGHLGHQRGQPVDHAQDVVGRSAGGQGHGADHRPERRVHRGRLERLGQHVDQRRGRGQPHPPAPAGRRRRPGRGQQQDEADGRRPQDPAGVGEQGRPAGPGERPAAGQQRVGGVVGGDPEEDQRQAQPQQQPAHRVPGPPADQHRADGGGAHRGQQERHHITRRTGARSGRPARRISWPSQAATRKASVPRAHNPQAATAGQGGRRAGRAAVTAMAVVACRSRVGSPSRPSSPPSVTGSLRRGHGPGRGRGDRRHRHPVTGVTGPAWPGREE